MESQQSSVAAFRASRCITIYSVRESQEGDTTEKNGNIGKILLIK